MESLAIALEVPKGSGVYMRAQEIYHKASLRLGPSTKFTSTCLMACALKLAADGFNVELDLALGAKRAGVAPRALTSCLELVVSSVGGEIGLVSVDAIAKGIGYPAVGPPVKALLASLPPETARRPSLNPTNPTVMAACVHLVLQTIGLRVSLASLCGVAYANPQHVQRCALEIREHAGPYLASLEQDASLIKRIKEMGRTLVRKKRSSPMDAAVSSTESSPTNKRPSTIAPALPSTRHLRRDLTFPEQHCYSELGYAIMLASIPPSLQARSPSVGGTLCNF